RIPATKGRRLLIDIDNADNAALRVVRVASYQSGIYVLAHLEANREYVVKSGSSDAEKPEYDLHYFTDSLRQRPMDIGFLEVHITENAATASAKDSTGTGPAGQGRVAATRMESRSSGVLLWAVLALVLLFLLYFSVKMVKAIGKKESNDSL